jgi:hypothetical protein
MCPQTRTPLATATVTFSLPVAILPHSSLGRLAVGRQQQKATTSQRGDNFRSLILYRWILHRLREGQAAM